MASQADRMAAVFRYFGIRDALIALAQHSSSSEWGRLLIFLEWLKERIEEKRGEVDGSSN